MHQHSMPTVSQAVGIIKKNRKRQKKIKWQFSINVIKEKHQTYVTKINLLLLRVFRDFFSSLSTLVFMINVILFVSLSCVLHVCFNHIPFIYVIVFSYDRVPVIKMNTTFKKLQ